MPTLSLRAVEDTLTTKVAPWWLGSLNVLPSGRVGWYRRPDMPSRLGIVASAQGLLALDRLEVLPSQMDAIVETLRQLQRSDGSWSFVSTLNDIGVVDATAWAILGLAAVGGGAAVSSIAAGMEWLASASHPAGGWGIVPAQRFRTYSTALALRALASGGLEDSSVARAGLRRLISEVEGTSGVWCDFEGRLSIPSTCLAIQALRCSAQEGIELPAKRACRWLLGLLAQRSSWNATEAAGRHEEVEVTVSGGILRLEYYHFALALAIRELSESGYGSSPEVLKAATELLDQCDDLNFQSTLPHLVHYTPTWVVHDVANALQSVRGSFNNDIVEVWFSKRRVVRHKAAERRSVRIVRRYWPHFATVLLIGGATGVLLRTAFGLGNTIILSISAGIGVNLLSSMIYDFVRRVRFQRF